MGMGAMGMGGNVDGRIMKMGGKGGDICISTAKYLWNNRNSREQNVISTEKT